ncbi:MAG: molecular chaperone SurA [Comamonadaceae bacterium]|nr:MAG: molecular chaperone SurA [Comamonadaceae bacterium]
MNHFRTTTLTLACLAALAASSVVQAQGFRPSGSRGITDIVRGGVTAPPPVPTGAARAPAPSTTQQQSAEYIVALVNSEPITNTDVQTRLNRILRENPQQTASIPRAELVKIVLERLISERAQLQLAKDYRMDIDDVAVDQAEQTVARQNDISLAELRRRLAAEGIPQAEFRGDLRRQLLLTKVREREVDSKVKVSDSEVDQYIREQRDTPSADKSLAIGTVTQTQARHILLRNDPKRSTADAIAQLTEFKKRIQSGNADFAGLARDNSQDGSAKDGGDLGWTNPGQFVPEFEDAMNRLKPNEVSDPVVSRFGVHLIQVVGRRETKLSQAEQRDIARIDLRDKKINEAYETWAQETRTRAYVEYREPPQS